MTDYYVWVKSDQFFRQAKHALDITRSKPIFDVEVLTDNPALLRETLLDNFGACLSFRIVREPHEDADCA
jgi:hypothetical protein